MKRCRIMVAAVCMVVVLCGLFPTKASANTDIWFTAVNDILLNLTADSMPVVSGGIAYVPYTVFDANVTNVNLGVFPAQNKAEGTFTLYNRQSTLIFDLNAGTCRDKNETYSYRGITRNGKTYLPISFVCAYFGLNFSYLHTEYGTLVRVTTTSAVLSDTSFVDAASQTMNARLIQYRQWQATTAQPTISPSAEPSASIVSHK